MFIYIIYIYSAPWLRIGSGMIRLCHLRLPPRRWPPWYVEAPPRWAPCALTAGVFSVRADYNSCCVWKRA